MKNGVILMLILLCIAFLVSCAKKDSTDRTAQGELVKIETGGNVPFGFIFILVTGKNIDRIPPACYNDTILKRKGERDSIMEEQNKNAIETTPEDQPENKETEIYPKAKEEEKTQNYSSRSYILWILAGLYLLYTGYSLCEGVIKGEEGGNAGFFAAGIVFLLIGAVLLFKGAKNTLLRNKNTKAAEDSGIEQAAAEEDTLSPEKKEKKPMSIAERARLADHIGEEESEEE